MTVTTRPTESGQADYRRCVAVIPTVTYEGVQNADITEGISAQTAGAERLCLHRVVIPASGHGRPHRHDEHESALYVISGNARTFFGADLSEHLDTGPGEMLYIPAGVPHFPVNLSSDEPVHAVLARTDPNEQESVQTLPELDRIAKRIVERPMSSGVSYG
jgi:uncharacterized RmlC-like cupin family protein